MITATACVCLLFIAAGAWIASARTRELAEVVRRLHDAPPDERHAGRVAWGRPDAVGVERLDLVLPDGRRAIVDLAGADLLALRPTRERPFEEGTAVLVLGGLEEDHRGGLMIAGARGRRLVATDIDPRDAGRWAARTLRRARATVIVCALLCAGALALAVTAVP